MQYQPLLHHQYYHIYNRGNNGEDIFLEERNYKYFLQLLARHLLPVCEVLAYCMLKNHFHLLIKTKEDQEEKAISRAFSNFFNAYAKAISKAYARTGSLFQDRFKRILLAEESYLKNLILYIHFNPEHHHMVKDFRNYRYSSYSDYLIPEPSFLKKEDILTLFKQKENFVAIHEAKRKTGLDLNINFD